MGAIRSHRGQHTRAGFKPRPSIETAPQLKAALRRLAHAQAHLVRIEALLWTQGREATLAGVCCPAKAGPSHASRGKANAHSWHRQPLFDDLLMAWSEGCGLPVCGAPHKQVRLLPLDRTGLCLRINWQGASCALLGNLEQLSLFEGRGSRKGAGQHSWL